MTVEISKQDVEWAHAQGLISAAQVEPFGPALEGRARGRARFDLPHVTYYFGALVVMSAMGWFVNRAWERFGGAGLLLIAIIYALGFSIAGHRLWVRQRLRVPGGLLFSLAVWMTPLGIYGFQRMTGIWLQQDPGAYRNYYEWVKGGWFFMEVGTILAGLGVLWFGRFRFLTFPVAFALWFMSMDLTPLIYGRLDFTWNQRVWVSLWFGLAFLVLAFLVDRRTRDDYVFWGVPLRRASLWGRALSDGKRERTWQARLLSHQRRAGPALGTPRPSGLHGVWRPGHLRLPRSSRLHRLQGLAPVPVRALGTRSGGHLAGNQVPAQPSLHRGNNFLGRAGWSTAADGQAAIRPLSAHFGEAAGDVITSVSVHMKA